MGDRREALALSSVQLLVLPPLLRPPPGITRAPRSQAAALVAMMMMSRTQPPREEAAEAQISCRRGLAGGRAAEQAGPVRTRPALFRGRRDSARGPGAARGAGARERGLSPIKRRPLRSLPNVPRTSPVFLLLLLRLLCCALASAPGHLKRFIQTWLCSALSRVGRSSAQDFPPWCFSPAPFLPLALMYPSLVSTSGPARVYL